MCHGESFIPGVGQRSGLVFADVLTQLLEDIAGVIERYYSVVETVYGPKWTRLLVQKLQVSLLFLLRWGLLS